MGKGRQPNVTHTHTHLGSRSKGIQLERFLGSPTVALQRSVHPRDIQHPAASCDPQQEVQRSSLLPTHDMRGAVIHPFTHPVTPQFADDGEDNLPVSVGWRWMRVENGYLGWTRLL